MKIITKSLILLVVSFFSISTFAQDQLLQKVQRISERMNTKIQNKGHRLSEEQLQEILYSLKTIRSVIRNGSGPNPPRNSIDAKLILLAGMSSISDFKHKSKAVNAGIESMNFQSMARLKSSCDQTSTWNDNTSCLRSGLNSLRGYFEIGNDTAKELLSKMCVQTKTWSDEASCFERSLQEANSDELYNLSVGCSGISNAKSKSKCYEHAFN